MTVSRALLPLAALVSALSCDPFSGGACTLEARAAISLEIRHAVTSAPLADSATALVTEGPFSDTLMVCGLTGAGVAVSRCGAWERAGTYDVLVTRPGFQAWSRAAVRVTRDACHVQGVAFQAQLQPTPQ